MDDLKIEAAWRNARVRLKKGARYMQDFSSLAWGDDDSPIFQVRGIESGFLKCVADGWGMHEPEGKYGNGAIYVSLDDIWKREGVDV